jgi:probable rRNA maturation factor
MNKSTQPVSFHFQKKGFSLPGRGQLKDFLLHICRAEKKKLARLEIIFCSDQYLLELNRRFLNHDFYTDILSFSLGRTGAPIEGEIYISIDRVRENAKSYGDSLSRELHRVIFHGTLHFCGYRDKTVAEKGKMRAREDKYLKLYGKGVPRRTVSR